MTRYFSDVVVSDVSQYDNSIWVLSIFNNLYRINKDQILSYRFGKNPEGPLGKYLTNELNNSERHYSHLVSSDSVLWLSNPKKNYFSRIKNDSISSVSFYKDSIYISTSDLNCSRGSIWFYKNTIQNGDVVSNLFEIDDKGIHQTDLTKLNLSYRIETFQVNNDSIYLLSFFNYNLHKNKIRLMIISNSVLLKSFDIDDNSTLFKSYFDNESKSFIVLSRNGYLYRFQNNVLKTYYTGINSLEPCSWIVFRKDKLLVSNPSGLFMFDLLNHQVKQIFYENKDTNSMFKNLKIIDRSVWGILGTRHPYECGLDVSKGIAILKMD